MLAIIAAVLALALQISTHAPAAASTKVIWVGDFTAAYAGNSTPLLTASTEVLFQVSSNLNDPNTYGAAVKVFDQAGTELALCMSGTACGVTSNPAPGTSKTYHAEVWAPRVGGWQHIATSSSVTVTDPGWTGSFTSVYAANPSPVLSEGTNVVFGVDRALSSAEVRVFSGSGTYLGACNSGSSCSWWSNPAPGSSLSYYAELWVVRNGSFVKHETSATVTVTDPGWTGSFTNAYAVNPTPVLSEGTNVTFSVDRAFSSAEVRMFTSTGTYLGACNSGSSCSWWSNPAPGSSLSYYAELWVVRNGTFVRHATSSTVTVTDPGWTGSFTSAYAVNPTPVLSASTSVIFEVGGTLSSAEIRMFDGAGTYLGACNSGSSCSVTSNPAPGGWKSYYAELWVLRNGSFVRHATSSTVTVTDPGWTGSFTNAYAVNPTPVLSASTSVIFEVGSTLSSAEIRMFSSAGTYLGACNWGTSCSVTANPAPGGWKSYYAELWAARNGTFVKIATSASVVVADPGWTGQFTGAETTVGDHAFLGATSARFTWNEPLQYAWVDVVDSTGEVLATCSATGSLECTAGRALGPDESEMVHAEARMAGPNGTHVTIATSASVELTGMDADAYATFILTAPEASLVPLLGTLRTAQAVNIRTAKDSLTFCAALGVAFPANDKFHASQPDATVLCLSGTVLALSFLITTMGIDLALDIMSDAAETDGQLGAPSYDPETGGTIFDDPDCHFYSFDGTCLEYPDLHPAPELVADADGARIPPPPNCLSDAARQQMLDESDMESHHIITKYANEAPPDASPLRLQQQVAIQELWMYADAYHLNIEAPWNKIAIPHQGPHPPEYHIWVRDQVEAIDDVADGDAAIFLQMWEILLRDVIDADPTIVRYEFWRC
jgi:deoxycytidine triphosphate deaminase